MRRITLWLLSTIAAVVLLFSYRTSTMGTGGSESAVVAAAVDGSSSGSSGDAGTDSGGTGTVATDSGSYDGTSVQTRWGPVQVRITVADGRITDVTAVSYPNGNRHDQQINARALPILREEVLAAQSADIDTVSGATDTSEGYLESLQAAIDAAHL